MIDRRPWIDRAHTAEASGFWTLVLAGAVLLAAASSMSGCAEPLPRRLARMAGPVDCRDALGRRIACPAQWP